MYSETIIILIPICWQTHGLFYYIKRSYIVRECQVCFFYKLVTTVIHHSQKFSSDSKLRVGS